MTVELDKQRWSAAVKACLHALMPAMGADGGGVEIVRETPETLELRMIGACVFCPSRPLTIDQTLLPALRAVLPPEVRIEFTAA